MHNTYLNAALVAQLRAWATVHGYLCVEHGEATELRVHRDGLVLRLTVPHGVSEWFVDVCDASDKILLRDWLDYAGYDNTPADALALGMREEVMRFVDQIGTHPVRLHTVGGPAPLQLQWQDAQQWHTCVPFIAAHAASTRPAPA